MGGPRPPFVCAYSQSLAYRIYSACGSFYIPMIIMLFVYARIFHVANEREKMMGQTGGMMRFSMKRNNKKGGVAS